VFLDDSGHVVEPSPARERLFASPAAGRPTISPGPRPVVRPITIQPDTNTLTLTQTDVFDETITVTVPKNGGTPKADVYFLADTTGSMTSILAAVRAGANNVLAALGSAGVDLAFGVGNYKDFESGDPFAFQPQQPPTTVPAAVTSAINAWAASGGADYPEAALFALDSLAVPPGGTIGWRPGSKRIVVWFGDAPSHDPICPAVSGAPAPITEATVTAKLVAEGITVLAISTATPGLDDDPTTGATGYLAKCGPPGGTAGQGSRIAGATGGTFVAGVNPGTIVDTIIKLVAGALSSIRNLTLVPSPSIAPFVASISPATGFGPLFGDQEYTLPFQVRFQGAPCKPEPQVITGTLDVVADGVVVAAKQVSITIPPCPFVYAVKFVCGTQPDCGCECAPVQPGRYATEINIHNFSNREVLVVKRIIPLVVAGAPVGREPRVGAPVAEDRITLPPHTATMDDCCRLSELVFGVAGASPAALTIGILELTADTEIAVTAVYTTSGLAAGGVALDVQQVAGRRA
jgi:hypothetical protein